MSCQACIKMYFVTTVNPLLSGLIEPQGHPDMGKTRIWCRLSLWTFPPFWSPSLCAESIEVIDKIVGKSLQQREREREKRGREIMSPRVEGLV